MDVVNPIHLSIGDVIEGPDGPEQITEISGSLLSFRNKGHCLTVSPREKITRHVTAEVLCQAGILGSARVL